MYKLRLALFALATLVAAAPSLQAQNQYIGYVYPAGGQQGNTFPVRLGGQGLIHACDIVVSGEGVSARLVDYYRVMNNQELGLLRQQLNELKKPETTVDDVMASKMAWFEFPEPIGPPPAPDPNAVQGLICAACGRVNPLDATVCSDCNANLAKPDNPEPGGTGAAEQPAVSENEVAKQKLIDRIERIFAEDERTPAVSSQAELVFAEITVEPDAKPGRREIRVITKRGVSNALPFYVGQVPEVARKPMKTCQLPVLGKESLAQRKRPPEEEELRVTLPCTVNGQIAPGEVNRYRFPADKGQRLVLQVQARDLVPYVADGVPGWFQAVLKLYDANGREVAYNDDFRSNPDPLIYYEVPEDGEYVLTINEALFRGRESFVYRITMGELPFVTSVFPLGGRAGESLDIELEGWNLERTGMAVPLDGGVRGKQWIAATSGEFVSNFLPLALGELPECLAQEPNDQPATAQKVTLPVIINGRAELPGDWDVFEVEGTAGQTIVAEVHARRLGSPFDSFVKVTNEQGQIIALNDDHYDAASGLNTDHADSYLMVTFPADGKYFVHIGDTRQHAGTDHAYRLRISHPQPDFELRMIPSRICIRSKEAANLTVFAIRKDGFTGPITLSFQDLPEGFESSGATLGSRSRSRRAGAEDQPYRVGRAGQPDRGRHGEGRGSGNRPPGRAGRRQDAGFLVASPVARGRSARLGLQSILPAVGRPPSSGHPRRGPAQGRHPRPAASVSRVVFETGREPVSGMVLHRRVRQSRDRQRRSPIDPMKAALMLRSRR
jgi:hypothetical protein